MKSILVSIFLLSIFSANSQSLTLIKDVNIGANDCVESTGTSTIQIGNKIFFEGRENEDNLSLFVIENNTVTKVANTCVSCTSGSKMVNFQNKLYYSVYNSNNGKFTLYVTDGNPQTIKNLGEIIEPKFYYIFDDKLYFSNENYTYYLDNEVPVRLGDFISLVPYSNNDNNVVTEYNGGFAVVNKVSDSVFVYHVKDNKVSKIGRNKFSLEPNYPTGLINVNGGLLFNYGGQIQFYNQHTSKIEPITTIPNQVTRIIPFKENQPILMIYNKGTYILENTSPIGVTKLTDRHARPLYNEIVNRAVYNDKMALITDEFYSYCLFTDGTVSGTTATEIESYTSNFIQNGAHVIFADGVSNGFDPSLKYINLISGKLQTLKSFSESSVSGPSLILLGMVGSKLYLFSNLNAQVGREVYVFETGINTATTDLTYSNAYNIVHGEDFLTINNSEDGSDEIILNVYNSAGIQILSANTGLNTPIT